MNVIDRLLKLDANKIQLPTKEVEITRLSDLSGEKVVFKLQGVKSEKLQSIREMAIKGEKVDMSEIRFGTILAGVVEPNLKDASLLSHYSVPTPYDLIDKLLLPGEIEALYEDISELSGFNGNAVQEVKN